MNVTFMIGNGFDLNCGLKTSYKDVYEGYCKTPSQSVLIEEFKKDIDDDLKQNKDGKLKRWGDFEVAMAKYMVNFENEDDFITCILDFKEYLNSYLFNVNREFNQIITKRSNDLINEMYESLNSFYDGGTNNTTKDIEELINVDRQNKIGIDYKVISFNYTDSFEKLCELRKSNGLLLPRISINHIHGVLNNNVVLGMDNIEQIKDLKFELSESCKLVFVKNYFNEKFDRRRLRDAVNAIKFSDVICVFGMSLGESDLTWRNLLLDWVSKKDSAHLLIFNHKLSQKDFWSADLKMIAELSAKNELLQKKWGLDADLIDKISDKIHIPCGKNIFNIKSVLEKPEIHTIGATVERPLENAIF